MTTITKKATIHTASGPGTAADLTSILDMLMRAFRAHVHGRRLPAPVMVSFCPRKREVEVQPDGGTDLARNLGNVLLWGHTLGDVSATWWRTRSDNLHVSVRGRTSIGVRILVYGGGDFADCAGLVSLDPDQTDGVSLDELYALVCLLRENQQQDQQNGRQVAHDGTGKEVA